MIKDLCVSAAQDINSVDSIDVGNSRSVKTEMTTSESEKPGTVFLDLCCGTGTIGISMANHVKQVIGVEMNGEAIKDAEKNAELNGVKNVKYYAAKIEDVSYGLFKNIDPNDHVIAVLDPPRTGVHYSVIKSIRDTPKLKHLIFVACE